MATAIQFAYLTVLAFLSIFGVSYNHLTPGLAYQGPNGTAFCNDLVSSGGDDSALVWVFSLFSIPLLLRLMRLSRPVSIIEKMMFWLIAILVTASLYLRTSINPLLVAI